MKLLIIRHGDPDYSTDSLTPAGKLEAEALAEYLKTQEITNFYVSPLGRAQATANYTLDKMGRTAETMPWLQEFPARVRVAEDPVLTDAMPLSPYMKGGDGTTLPWDVLPYYWTSDERYFHKEDWRNTAICAHSDTAEVYKTVCEGLDALLKKHGYARNGNLYRAERSNHDVIAFFCHFGVECALLSHLLNISPFALWHGFVAAPSSITTLHTEERQKGVAYWRAASFGDISHLRLAGLAPAFHARFCECFDDDTRH